MSNAALSVVPTEPAKKGQFLFQINTPRRIYHLQAESQQSMDYWINGTSDILKSLSSNEDGTAAAHALHMLACAVPVFCF